MNFRAQGTIEYLVVIAIVIVISLLVSFLFLTQTDNALMINNYSNNVNQTNLGGISIVDSITTSNGDAVVSFMNETGENLTIEEVTVINSIGEEGSASLDCIGIFSAGHEKVCVVPDVDLFCPCVDENPVTCSYKIVVKGKIEPIVGTITNHSCATTATTYTLTYIETDGGTISGNKIQNVLPNGNGTPVRAIPDEYYVFVDWNDGLTNPTRTDYGVNSDITVEANFDLVVDCISPSDCESNETCEDNICVPIEDGSEEFPFIINDCVELQEMINDVESSYALGKDIDCSETINWNFNGSYYQGFAPVGRVMGAPPYSPFKGNFDGRNYTISNLYIYRPTYGYVGLFSYSNYSSTVLIKNVKLVDVNITGENYVGSIIGTLDNGVISNVSSSGVVNGNETVGGLIGAFTGLSVSVTNSSSTANVTGANTLGGLIGSASQTVSNCYATGNVVGNTSSGYDIGGLVGYSSGNISNSYAIGNVTGNFQVGSLIGGVDSIGVISNSFGLGEVNGNTTSNGLIGRVVDGTISNNYWDTYFTGKTNCYEVGGWEEILEPSNEGCSSTTNNESWYYSSSNAPLSSWTWGEEGNWITQINDYPILSWQEE